MKANELRIGNLITIYSKESPAISETHLVEPTTLMILLNTIGSRGMAFKAIPLTEEWLIKLGYAQDVDTPFFKINMPRNIGYIHYNPNNQITWLKHHNSDSALNPQSLFYVHQLQNLYFALTGEELVYNNI